MTTINTNQPPYFDDFNDSKKFYQILFRPGRAVQARELNQLQTILKSQLDRLGKFVFDNGSVVYPIGAKEAAKYANNVGFIKVPATSGLFTDTEANLKTYWLGKKIISTAGPVGNPQLGITATVVGVRAPDSLNQARLYLNYIEADSSTGTYTKFSPEQTISTVEALPISITISAGTTSVGLVSSVTVQESIYFYNGRFVLVDEQTLFITPTESNINTPSAWNNVPTASIGLQFIESVKTWVEDSTLLDNATGTPNIGAPGADRLHVAANLIQLDINSTAENFVELIRVESGDVKKKVTKTDLSDQGLEKTLATRTFEESGDYTVTPFLIRLQAFLRTSQQEGANAEELFHFDSEASAAAASVSVFGLTSPGKGAAHPTIPGKYVPGNSYNTLGDAESFISLCEQRLSVIIDPGVAYVNGYRIEKLSTTNVTLKKARETRFQNNRFVSTPLGNYIYVKNLYGGLETQSYDTVDLYDAAISSPGSVSGNKIGTARVLAIEYFTGYKSVGADTRLYRLFLFNVEMLGENKFERVKSIYSASPTFTCDVELERFRLTGSVTKVDDANDNLINGAGTSWRNNELERLIAGDFIEVASGNINPATGAPVSKIYKLSENPSTDNQLKIVGSHASDSWPAGSSIDYLYALLRTTSDESGLIYRLPDEPIATIRGAFSNGDIDNSSIDTVYTARKVSSALTPSSNTLTISGTSGLEFEAFNPTSYSVVALTGPSAGTWLQVLPYTTGTPAAGTAYVRPNFSNNLVVYLNSSDATGGTFQVHYTEVKLGGAASQEKIKTLVKGSFSGGLYSGNGWAVSSGTDVTEISLGYPDVLRITRVVESPDYSTTPSSSEVLPTGHTDVTALYVLDNGQRDYYYDIAKVYLRPGYSRPRGRIRVEFDYFTHSGNGDYFSVNSYPFVGGTNPTQTMDYGDIPTYTSSDGSEYDLSSCLDFRPIVGAGGINSAFSYNMAIPKDDVRCDYHFYLPRKDLLILDANTKNFSIKSGKSDVDPVFPIDPDNSMVIYEFDLGAYTYGRSSVGVKMRENKRYTMQDIGKLERRINNLEYYTSLSLLEKDTNSLSITDALGRERFKNGFLVDNFKNTNSAELSSDFSCTFDHNLGIIRPKIYEDPNPPRMFEKALLLSNPNLIDSHRLSKNYQKTGDLYTLRYTTSKFINQSKASKYVNINPYSVFVYVGNVKITPWTDEWRETAIAEPLNIKDENAWQASRSTFGSNGSRIDYSTTVNNWISVSSSKELITKNLLLQAGHAIGKKVLGTKYNLDKWEKETLTIVPPGYPNAGQKVPTGYKNIVAEQHKTTTTQTGDRITTNFVSTFQDQGWSQPVNLGDRIIDTALIEYIRTKDIQFTGQAFKPKARVYPFFDNVDVSQYCKPINGAYGAPLICDSAGSVSGIFTIPDPKTSLLKFRTGDRIFRLTTSSVNSLYPAPDSAGDARYTARGWIDTKQQSTLSTRLFGVANNTTTSSDPISQVLSETFSVENACAQDPLAQSFLVKEQGGCFVTSVDIYFATKPSSTSSEQPPVTLQLRTMSDDGFPTYSILPFGTVVKQASEVITNVIDSVNGKLIVTGSGGPWKSGTNGTYDPSGEISSTIPYSYTGNPNVDMVPTRFTFESPIYLAEGSYYSIVLIANSTEYNVWVAESGPDTSVVDVTVRSNNLEIGTSTPIESPVFLDGVLFYSENGINWIQKPNQDLKFTLHKAVFNTSVSAEIDYVNDEVPLRKLTLDPFEFSKVSDSSQTGSIRVMHPNHGHTTARTGSSTGAASKVVFSPNYDITLTGLTSTLTNVTISSPGNFNNIPVGAYIKHPVTGEQRRVIAKPTSTSLTIRNQFLNEITSTMTVSATTYVLPSGANLGGINSDVLFDYRGFDVQQTELDYYRINISKASGTVAVTNGSPAVTGTQTAFTTDYIAGDTIIIDGASYTILSIATDTALTLTTNYVGATASGLSLTMNGRFGGSNIVATENKRYEELMLLTTPIEIPQVTQIDWNIQTISGSGVNDSTNSTYVVQPRRTLFPNERLVFDSPMLIGSYINELPPAGSPETVGGPSTITSIVPGDRKSLQVRAVLRSNNPNLSPIIDESRFTAMLIANQLDDPRGISEAGVDSAQIINTDFDNYVCVPTTTSPAVATTNGLLWFTASSVTATGTVSGSAGGRTLIGTGTSFITQLKVGDTVTTTEKETRKVSSIISNTELLLDYPLVTSASGSLYINPANLKIKSADANIAKQLSNLDVGKYVSISNTAVATAGTITTTTSSTSVTGVGTSFNSSYIGIKLYNTSGALIGTVASVSSTTSLTLTSNALVAVTGANFITNFPGSRDFQDKLILGVSYTPNNTVVDSDLSNPKLIEIEIDHKILGSAGFDAGVTSRQVTITQKDRFVDEIAPSGGSCQSKYLSKKLAVQRPSNALRVMFEGSRDETCNIELYYKLDLVNSPIPFDEVNWIKSPFNVDDNGKYVEITPEPNLSNVFFSEYESTLGDLPAFIGAQVKIVMRGGNPARSIRIKNLRLIVLDD